MNHVCLFSRRAWAASAVCACSLVAFAINPVYVDCNLADYTGHDGSTPAKAVATIQEGVDASETGGTVSVAAGVYASGGKSAASSYAACRVYIDHAITLKGAGRDVTHIVGAFGTGGSYTNIGSGAVGGIVIASGAASATRIEGFTIRDCGDSKLSDGKDGQGTAVRSLQTNASNTIANRPWIVDCAISNIYASVGAVSYANVARTIFMNCVGHSFASAADYSDLVYCIVAHQQQETNNHTFRGRHVSDETGNRIVNCTILDAGGTRSGVNLMSTSGPWYLQNSIVDYGGVFAGEVDCCVLASARSGLGAANVPVSAASTNETATSVFSCADRVVASVAIDDYRPIATCKLLVGSATNTYVSAALGLANTNNLSAFPEEFRWTDVYGHAVVPDADGHIHAGAVQTTMTPVAAFCVSTYSKHLRIDGRAFCRSSGDTLSRTHFTDVWPRLYRFEFPQRDELAAVGLSMPFFSFAMANDGAANRWVFPDSAERLPFVPAPGRLMTVTPMLATHVLYVDRAAEDGNAATGSGTTNAPYARIQKAVNSVTESKDNRAVIYVAPGTYDADLTARNGVQPACRISLGKSKTYFRLIGTGGAEQTIIPGAADPSDLATDGCLSTNAIRCVRSGGNPVALQGFTLTGGHTAGKNEGNAGNSYGRGGALYAENTKNAWLVECIVTNNVAYHGGAAMANGNAVKCYFADNRLACDGSIFDVQNSDGHWSLSSCVVDETNTTSKGTVFLQSSSVPGYAVNCTVRGNDGLYLFTSSSYSFFVNCILTHAKPQSAASGFRRTSGTYCWAFDYAGGQGNAYGTTYYIADPQFVDEAGGDFHLLASSPAYGGGDAWTKMADETKWTREQVYGAYYRLLSCDRDGNFPVFVNGNPSAGAYQVASKTKMTVTANVPDDVTTTPAAGTTVVDLDEQQTVTATSAARQILGIRVGDTFFAGSTATFLPRACGQANISVEVVASTNWYVDAVNGSDANTGWTEATAFLTMTGALAHAVSGDVVTALPGVYAEGSALHTTCVYDKWNYRKTNDTIRLPSRAVVPAGVTLVSRDGPETTVIKGERGADSNGLGAGAVRCVFVDENAVLKGFTLTGGSTLTGAIDYQYEFFDNVSGGGILFADTPTQGGCGAPPTIKGYAENCIISNNLSRGGHAANFGTYVHCLFTQNPCAAVREANLMYGCVVGGNTCSGQACYQPYYVEDCTFLGTDHKSDGTPVPAIYSYPGSSYWPVRNSLFLGTKGNTLKWVFNCRFPSESALVARSGYTNYRWEGVSYDSTLAVDESYRPVRTCLAVDAWAAGSTAVSNVFKYAMPPAIVRATDFAGGQRVYNGVQDVGAGECDWRARYATVLGGGTRHQVTAASTNAVEVETGVRLVDGQSLASAFTALRAGTRQCEWRIAFSGTGTLSVSVNGGAAQTVDAEVFSPAVQKGANTFVFSYAGDGAAVLRGFAHFNGTVLVFR